MALANPLMNVKLLEGLKCVIFDCDGVLIDSLQANIHYYGNIKEQLGLPPLTASEIKHVHMFTHRDAIKHIVPDELFEQAWEVVRNFDSSSLTQYMTRSEGVREFLCWLRDTGFKLAVNTSRADSMDFILKLMDLEGFFFPVMTSGKLVSPKPHPEGMFKILRELDMQPEEVAYIGDSLVDEKAGRASGVRFWAYRNQSLSAQVHIESFWDIKAAMQRCYKGFAPRF
ncbi:HAD family hydrolase [Pseudodesulfovibrio piezophilus]|uniref:phosphoglycolate phosphatase n=1 Tax=Pseudodesulfovibrio piezophilus (strain DSM 21447 / JCM 15486 / C1TLV30) TaxID=1322246 RepID=M1WQB1_PSEP2|nr:HAD hydrolase-like protein [Pseudodesulfovibrio piezophilus]CCH47602.1 HAD-superfamily hydrolase, subfamily IA, variant 3 [Pseudodesulfovibrio piezophilus C1TLV30]